MTSNLASVALTAYRQAGDVAGAWSRRRWLAGVGGLACGAGLSPIAWAAPRRKTGESHEETLRVFVDALLPADDLTPAASHLGVHTQILQAAGRDAALGMFIRDGCRWLEQSVGALAALDSGQMERLLQMMSEAGWDSGPRVFFHEIRDRAVLYYYSDSRAWAGLAIQRPPQPLGYPDAVAA